MQEPQEEAPGAPGAPGQPPPPQGPADQFSDQEMEGIQKMGQALGGRPTSFDEEVEKHLSGEAAHEREATKMRAAQTGGGGTGLGPEEEAQLLAKQQQTLQQQAAAQGQQQAAQAQAQQQPHAPPPAPTGPQGVTQPYPAQQQPEEEQK
jgi:hypothetical protein